MNKSLLSALLFLSIMAPVYSIEFSLSAGPSPSFITKAPEYSPLLRGFEIFTSLEMNFCRLLSINADYKFAYMNYSQEYKYPYEFDENDFMLELRLYPVFFLPILNGFFVCAGAGVSLDVVITNSAKTAGSILSVNARIGYKWVIFGEKGVFIQPSFGLNYYLAGQEKFSNLLNYDYGLKTELGWVF
jgi:hypothetical protein